MMQPLGENQEPSYLHCHDPWLVCGVALSCGGKHVTNFLLSKLLDTIKLVALAMMQAESNIISLVENLSRPPFVKPCPLQLMVRLMHK